MPEDATLARLILAVLDAANRPLTPEEIIVELPRRGVIVEGDEELPEPGH